MVFTARPKTQGFALEASLPALAFPMANRMLATSHSAKCGHNVRTLIGAIHAFAADNDGDLSYFSDTARPPGEWLWWRREIVPYLDSDRARLIPNPAAPFQGTGWLPDVFRCPADKYRGETWGLNPSYGINHNLTKTIPLAGHQEEDGGPAWRAGSLQAVHGFRARHDGHGTIGWLDCHVTLAPTTRLDELHNEPRPWSSWLPPQMVP